MESGNKGEEKEEIEDWKNKRNGPWISGLGLFGFGLTNLARFSSCPSFCFICQTDGFFIHSESNLFGYSFWINIKSFSWFLSH